MKRFLLLAIPFLAGCFSSGSSDYRYYVLDYVPTASKTRLASGPWGASILVRNFTLGEAYLRPELVYRTSAHEMLYHWQHRWAVQPEHVVSDMARRHLREVKVFRTVQDQYDEDQPDFELRGRVGSMEEYVTENHRFAHLDLKLSFVRMSDGKVLWSEAFDLRREVLREEPVYVVRGLSSLLEASMDRTIGAIDSIMESQRPRP